MEQISYTKQRIALLDEVRGFSILCMVFYHFTFDLLLLFPISFPFFYSPWMNGIRDIFAGIFIFISGCACRFSHNNCKRGLFCLLFGMIMTFVTIIVIPEQQIIFGILHMLGSCMILFSLVHPLLDQIKPSLALCLCIVLFLYTFQVAQKKFGIPYLFHFTLPSWLYQTNWLSPLGFYNENFVSSDYFPLFPWMFLFFAGTIIGKWILQGQCPNIIYQSHCPVLGAVGRHTIYIYLLHQPILFTGLFLMKQWVYV